MREERKITKDVYRGAYANDENFQRPSVDRWKKFRGTKSSGNWISDSKVRDYLSIKYRAKVASEEIFVRSFALLAAKYRSRNRNRAKRKRKQEKMKRKDIFHDF